MRRLRLAVRRAWLAALAAGLLAFPKPAGAAGKTGASFLKIAPTAQSTILNMAGIREDGSSILMNPGALSRVSQQMLCATYAPYLLDSNYSFMAYTYPTGLWNISGSFVRLGMGSIEGRAADRSRTGSFSAEDASFGVALSRDGWGAHLKFVRQTIGEYSAQGAAVDLGWHSDLRPGIPLVTGLAVRNLGPKMRFLDEGFDLPTSVEASLAYPFAGSMFLAFAASRELHQNETQFTVGTQYQVADLLFLRAGYAVAAGAGASRQPYPAAGLGLGLGQHSLDYAFMPFQDLGTVHKISFSLRFK